MPTPTNRLLHTALIATLVAPMASACSGLSGTHRATFDQVALNQTWYGAYHRPLPDAEPRRRARPADPAPSSPVQTASIPAAVGSDYEPSHAAAYVRDVYSLNETSIGGGDTDTVVDVYRFVSDNGTVYHDPRPAVGDLAFFHNTFDANGDRRPNDWYTHVGIVESVDASNTVTVLSFVDDSVTRLTMNLDRPDDATDGGVDVNSTLREPSRDDTPHTQYLAGQLFAGFGSLLGERTQVIVLDDWNPSSSPSLQARR